MLRRLIKHDLIDYVIKNRVLYKLYNGRRSPILSLPIIDAAQSEETWLNKCWNH